MPKTGYTSLTIDNDADKEIIRIQEKEKCKKKSEVIRLLLRAYRKNSGPPITTTDQSFIANSFFENFSVFHRQALKIES